MAYINEQEVLFSAEVDGLGVIDAELNVESENPVQNKVITNRLNIKVYENLGFGGKGNTVNVESNGGNIGNIYYGTSSTFTSNGNKKYILFAQLNSVLEETVSGLDTTCIFSTYGTHGTNNRVSAKILKTLTQLKQGNNNIYCAEYTINDGVTVYPYLYFTGATGKPFNFTLEKLFILEVEQDDNFNYLDYLQTIECEQVVLINALAERVRKIENKINSNATNIYCFGDSQTGGGHNSETHSYPYFLQELLGYEYEVLNNGNGGENINAIAFRTGVLPLYLSPFTLPADTSQVNITSILANDRNKGNLFTSWNGSNPVQVGGIACYLRNTGTIARVAAGETETTFDRPILAIPPSPIKTTTGVYIFQVGANGGFSGIDEYIAIISSMINAISDIEKKYIVICPWHSYFNSLFGEMTYNEIIERMYDAFGEHFLDIRTYLANYGLADNDIEATETDETQIENNEVPASLRFDGVHLNKYGYSSQAKKIFQFGKDLGYW